MDALRISRHRGCRNIMLVAHRSVNYICHIRSQRGGDIPKILGRVSSQLISDAGGCASSHAPATATMESPQLSSTSPPCLHSECGSSPSMKEVQELLPHLTPKQLADALWYFARHDVRPDLGFMDAVAEEMHNKLAQCRGQDLSSTVGAFATLNYQPSEHWWRDFEMQVFQVLTELTDRQVANLLWAFAVLERRPSQLQPASAPLVPAPHGTVAAPAEATAALEKCMAIALLPDRPLRGCVLDSLLAHSCAGGFVGYSASNLHLLVWSLGKLHLVPPASWLETFLPAAEAHFFRFTPTELANIIWALAKLGADLPSEWLDKLLLVAQWRFPSFSARLLSTVAWSTATLAHRPQQEWLMCFEEQVRSKFLEFSGHELACVAWSLRRFGYSTRDNAVFYMLQKQQSFLAADFEILSNPNLLRQVLGWKAAVRGKGPADADEHGDSSCGGGGRETGPA